MRKGFTLIEVMVSVMIISTVIMALLKMYGNNVFIFSNIKQNLEMNQYATLFLSKHSFGFEDDEIWLDDLVSEFDVEDSLRRRLKDMKVKIIYQKLDAIDLANFDGSSDINITSSEEEKVNSTMLFEVGKTVIKIKDNSVGFLRLRLN